MVNQVAADEREQNGRRPGLRFPTATELFARLPEIEESLTARPRTKDQDPLSMMSELATSAVPEEAVTLASFALPTRHAVWWGHECLRRTAAIMVAQDERMLELAAAWVADPSEDTRYAALDAAMEAKTKTPGVWVALGAGWSGGSMVPKDYQPVRPPEFLPCRAINAAVLTALALTEKPQRGPVLGDFIRMAIALANDG